MFEIYTTFGQMSLVGLLFGRLSKLLCCDDLSNVNWKKVNWYIARAWHSFRIRRLPIHPILIRGGCTVSFKCVMFFAIGHVSH